MSDNRSEELRPDADAKQKKRLDIWASGKNIRFESRKSRDRYVETATLFKDAVELKKAPARVPISSSVGHFPLEYAGLTFYEAMYDVDALIAALRRFHEDFDPDGFCGSHIGSGRILDLLDAQQYLWAGHGVSKDHEYQFVEKERMRADEYDELIADPTGFHFHKFLPRVSGTLKSLEKFPALVDLRHMSSMVGGVLPFADPQVLDSLQKLMQAGLEATRWAGAMAAFRDEMLGKGYPPFGGGMCEAPYDIIADSFRGTRGMSLDLIRLPHKVLQACEKYVPSQIRRAVAAADMSGNPFIFMPLHKGAHSFMSREQFSRFYWPTLRKLLIGMINEGVIPVPFAEADYNSRLDIIADLPFGKTVWMFEEVDMVQAKATVGRVACIAGNLPNVLFRSGGPQDVQAHCKQLIDAVGRDGGYVLSTAAGLQGARPENVKAMIDFVRSYRP